MVIYTSSSGPQRSFNIPSESCTNSVCQHTLNVSSAADYTVSVAAVNVVGQGRSEESSSISEFNDQISRKDILVMVWSGTSLQLMMHASMT